MELNLGQVIRSHCLMIRFFKGAGGAGNSARQFAEVGVYLSRLPSMQKSGPLPTKMGVSGSAERNIRFFCSK